MAKQLRGDALKEDMWRLFVETVTTETIAVPQVTKDVAWELYEANVDDRAEKINDGRPSVDECIVRAAQECRTVVAYMASKDKSVEMTVTPELYRFVCNRISEEVGLSGIVC